MQVRLKEVLLVVVVVVCISGCSSARPSPAERTRDALDSAYDSLDVSGLEDLCGVDLNTGLETLGADAPGINQAAARAYVRERCGPDSPVQWAADDGSPYSADESATTDPGENSAAVTEPAATSSDHSSSGSTDGTLGAVIGAVLLGYIIWRFFTKSGKAYSHKRFVETFHKSRAGKQILIASTFQAELILLGDPTDKPIAQILEYLGKPISYSDLGNGTELLQWRVHPAHLALVFKNAVCVSITHRYAC